MKGVKQMLPERQYCMCQSSTIKGRVSMALPHMDITVGVLDTRATVLVSMAGPGRLL